MQITVFTEIGFVWKQFTLCVRNIDLTITSSDKDFSSLCYLLTIVSHISKSISHIVRSFVAKMSLLTQIRCSFTTLKTSKNYNLIEKVR